MLPLSRSVNVNRSGVGCDTDAGTVNEHGPLCETSQQLPHHHEEHKSSFTRKGDYCIRRLPPVSLQEQKALSRPTAGKPTHTIGERSSDFLLSGKASQVSPITSLRLQPMRRILLANGPVSIDHNGPRVEARTSTSSRPDVTSHVLRNLAPQLTGRGSTSEGDLRPKELPQCVVDAPASRRTQTPTSGARNVHLNTLCHVSKTPFATSRVNETGNRASSLPREVPGLSKVQPHPFVKAPLYMNWKKNREAPIDNDCLDGAFCKKLMNGMGMEELYRMPIEKARSRVHKPMQLNRRLVSPAHEPSLLPSSGAMPRGITSQAAMPVTKDSNEAPMPTSSSHAPPPNKEEQERYAQAYQLPELFGSLIDDLLHSRPESDIQEWMLAWLMERLPSTTDSTVLEMYYPSGVGHAENDRCVFYGLGSDSSEYDGRMCLEDMPHDPLLPLKTGSERVRSRYAGCGAYWSLEDMAIESQCDSISPPGDPSIPICLSLFEGTNNSCGTEDGTQNALGRRTSSEHSTTPWNCLQAAQRDTTPSSSFPVNEVRQHEILLNHGTPSGPPLRLPAMGSATVVGAAPGGRRSHQLLTPLLGTLGGRKQETGNIDGRDTGQEASVASNTFAVNAIDGHR